MKINLLTRQSSVAFKNGFICNAARPVTHSISTLAALSFLPSLLSYLYISLPLWLYHSLCAMCEYGTQNSCGSHRINFMKFHTSILRWPIWLFFGYTHMFCGCHFSWLGSTGRVEEWDYHNAIKLFVTALKHAAYAQYCWLLGKWPRRNERKSLPLLYLCRKLNILWQVKLAAQPIKRLCNCPSLRHDDRGMWGREEKSTDSSYQQFAVQLQQLKMSRILSVPARWLPLATCRQPRATCHLPHCIFIFHLNCSLNAVLCALPSLLLFCPYLLFGLSSRVAHLPTGQFWLWFRTEIDAALDWSIF